MKNILILTYWSYKDALVQTYTLPYIRIIRKLIPIDSKIILVTFENKLYYLSADERKKIKKQLASENISWFSFSYSSIGIFAVLKLIASLLKLGYICVTQKISHIHAWCMQAGIFGYLLSVFTGKKLIIDSYEPHAEAMVENGTWKKNSLAFHVLRFFEKKQAWQAHALIATTKGMLNYSKVKFNLVPKRFYVKPACVNFDAFRRNIDTYNLRINLGFENKIVGIYAGKFGGIYLEKEIIQIFKAAYNYWPDLFRAIILTSSPVEVVYKFMEELNLPKEVVLVKFANHQEVVDYMSISDFALNPVKPLPAKRYCTSIKDGEYWAMGLPIIITKNISDDSEIIEKENIGVVLNVLNEIEYKDAIFKIDNLLKQKPVLNDRIVEIAKKYRSFEIAENIYADLYANSIQKTKI